MNSRNLFYVRYLQLRTLNVRNKELYALFFFEKELFRYYPKTEEKILSKIKLKWLFEEISKKNRNNFILKNFNDSEIVYLSKKALSYSSASTTKNSPSPRSAELSLAMGTPPIKYPGRSPAEFRIKVSIAVVVVLP